MVGDRAGDRTGDRILTEPGTGQETGPLTGKALWRRVRVLDVESVGPVFKSHDSHESSNHWAAPRDYQGLNL